MGLNQKPGYPYMAVKPRRGLSGARFNPSCPPLVVSALLLSR